VVLRSRLGLSSTKLSWDPFRIVQGPWSLRKSASKSYCLSLDWTVGFPSPPLHFKKSNNWTQSMFSFTSLFVYLTLLFSLFISSLFFLSRTYPFWTNSSSYAYRTFHQHQHQYRHSYFIYSNVHLLPQFSMHKRWVSHFKLLLSEPHHRQNVLASFTFLRYLVFDNHFIIHYSSIIKLLLLFTPYLEIVQRLQFFHVLKLLYQDNVLLLK